MAKDIYNLDLNLGFKTFRVKFAEFDDTVDILFNPADADLPKRLFEAQKKIEAETKSLENFKLNADGTPVADEYIEKANYVNNVIFDAVDYAFGNKISDKIFIHCSPLAITNGQPFIVQFFEKITPAIQSVIEAEQKKANAAAKKYLDKYQLKK